ncbi:MAG: hypothetical protein IKH32_01120 [Prevotella sp.]|nr:hypothetical protein [Prevotella sp.]
MAKKRKINPDLSYNVIPDFNTDWMDDPTNQHKRFSGESVQNFVKGELQKSYGYSRVASGYLQYFRSVEDADAYDQGDTSKLLHQDSLAGTNVEFRFMKQYEGNVYINGNNAYMFPLFVRSMDVNTDGSETPHDVNINLAIQVSLNGTTTTTELGMFPANDDFEVNVTPYVADGASFVFVASNETGDRRTSSRYSVVRANLGLGVQNNTWWATAYRKGDGTWNVPLTLDVNVPCELRAKIRKGGVEYVTKTVASSEFSTNYALMMGHPLDFGGVSGVYELHLELVPTDESLVGLETPELDFNIFCVAAAEANVFFLTNHVAEVLQNYANNKVLEYAVFAGSGNHTITFEAEVEGTAVTAPTTVAVVNGQVGTYYLNLELERLDNADFTTAITAHIDDGADVLDEDFTTSNSLGYAATPGATVLVKANGRSNSESGREGLVNIVTGETITPTWGNMTWSSVDGYVLRGLADRSGAIVAQSVLRLLSGETMEIPITPLAMRASEGRTLEIMFQPRNVRNYDTPIIQCLDAMAPLSAGETDENSGETDENGGGSFVGLKVTGDRITLLTTNRQNVDTQTVKYDCDEPIHLAIVVNPVYSEAGSAFAACMVFINGQRQRIFAYDRDLNVSSHLFIGSADADVDTFDIRTYDKALTHGEIETNCVNWQKSLYDKAYMKNLFNIRENGKVDINKVRAICNTFIFKSSDGLGRIPALGMSKGDKIHGTLKTYWRDTPAWNIEKELDEEGQGTTSMEYFRWNWKGEFDEPVAFDGGAHASITKICGKKNFASSMQSHKMGECETYDWLARETGAVERDAARQAIWQYPFVGFAEDGQGNLTFIGLYTIGPDKGDKNTFGFGSNTVAMEGLDNEPLSTNFRVPWNDSTVSPDQKNEKYYVCGEKAWEDSRKNANGVSSRWKPAYNITYECSQLIKPWKGATIGQTSYPATLEGLQNYGAAIGDIDTSTEEGMRQYQEAIKFEYWLSGTYELYYFNPATSGYMQSYTTAAIDLATQLCGKEYQVGTQEEGGVTVPVYLTTALLTAATDDDARNVLFKKARVNKFRKEASAHWDIINSIYHLAKVEFDGATDNKTKNTYPYLLDYTDGSLRWRWRQDDMDTVGPIENQGKDKKPYCVEFEDDYSDYGQAVRDVWNGRTNQFWHLLKEAFAEEYADFMRTRFIPAMHYGSGTDVMARIKAFFSHFYYDRAQEYFGAALYNADGIYSYDQAYLYEGSYAHKGIALEQALGDHYSAEKQWFRMRTIYMMSKYCADLFSGGNQTDVFTNRPAAGTNQYTITPAIYMYPVVQNGEQAIQGPRIWPGSNVTSWTTDPITTAGDQAFRINGMSYLRDIGNLYANTLDGPVSVNGSMLQTLLLGNHEDAQAVKSTITAVEIGNATSLRVLDLGNLTTLAGSPDLSSCVNLRTLYANGSSVAMVTLSDGGPLQTLVLGGSITSLQLLGKQMLETLTIGSTDRITQVEMQNCNAYTVSRVMSILAGIPVSRLTSVKLAFGTLASPSVVNNTDIATLIAIGAADIDVKQFSGYITKSSGSISGSTYAALEAMNITYVGDVDPEVVVGSDDVVITAGECTVFSGESATFKAQVSPPSAGTARFRLYNGNTPITEDGQGKATYNGVTLDCATGAMTTTVTATRFAVGVTAFVGSGASEVESTKVTVNVDKTVVIGGITISGTKSYSATGDNTLLLTPTNSDYTVGPSTIEIALTQGESDASSDEFLRVTQTSLAGMELKAAVLGIPSSTREYGLTVRVTDVKGNVYTDSATLTVQSIPVTGFDISGADTIREAGSEAYTIGNLQPSGYNRGIASVQVTANSALVSVSNVTTGGFTLSVAEMPAETTDVTVTVTATLTGGGNVTKTKTVQLKVGGGGGGDVIVIDESVADPATRVSGDVNGTTIQAIRDGSHRYLGKYVDDGNGGGKMLLCQLSDTDSTKFYDGTTAASLDGSMGDVWMKHPDVYIKATKEGDEVSLDISTSDNGGRLFPENDLIGVYEANYANSKLRSISGVQSTGNVSQANFHSYAAARGAGFSLVKPQHQNLMAVLFYAMYGHTNCQAICGAGTNANNKATGQTNSLGMTDTTTANGNSMSINFWGLENWWGNKYEWMDGVVINNGVWTITEDDGTTRTITAPTNSAWVYAKKFIWGDGIDVVPLASETGGSDSQGYCDGYYGTTDSSRVAQRSAYNAYTYGGVAYVDASYDSSYAYASYGSRLAFHGQIEVTTDVQAFIAATQKS